MCTYQLSRRVCYQGIMPKKIFIGGLSATTNNASLVSNFAPFGTIVTAAINYDGNGAPLGTGSVEYTTDQAGTDAIAAKNGSVLDGNRISVAAR